MFDLSEYMTPDQMVATASVLLGLTVFWVSRTMLSGLKEPQVDLSSVQGQTFEDRRRVLLRLASGTYRLFEPLIDVLAARASHGDSQKLGQLERHIQAAGIKTPWRPEEYIAVRQVEGAMLAGMFVLLFGLIGQVVVGVLFGGFFGLVYMRNMVGNPARQARRRLNRMKTRLPFVVDLMALMMESGAGFREALESAVKESGDNPLCDELSGVLRETDMGRTRREALLSVQQRLSDKDFSDLIFAIVKGEEMGTPLAKILRNQADQMRLVRTQLAEKEAGEAQVAILFPGLLVMVACILIIVAPFVLQVMKDRGGLTGLF